MVIYRNIQKDLKAALIEQRTSYLETIATEAEHAPRQQLYAKLKKAGFCSGRSMRSRPLPMLTNEEGEAIADPDGLKETWRRYFAAIECGRHVRQEELLQLCIYTEIEAKFTPAEHFLRGLPALRSLETALRRCKLHRAAGPDRLPPELCRHATRWMSHFLAPLYLKCFLYCAEPIHWKGGVLHEVWKRKGPTSDPNSYRGILVSSHVAKCYHNLFRYPTIEHHLATADPLHCGGTPGIGVEMATHALRSFLSLARQHHRPCGVFFLDIKSAYYKLLRCLAIGPTCNESELAYLLHTMGLPEELMHNLQELVKRPDALQAAGCPGWLQDFGVTFHRHTWFHIRDAEAATETLRGTRPGDGFADLLFSVVVGRILRDLERDLRLDGLQTTLTWNGHTGFDAGPGDVFETHALNITWADDIAVMVQHESSEELLAALQHVMTSYIERLASHGLLLNYDKGKTEALILLRGHGSRQLRRDLFAVEEPTIPLYVHGFGDLSIRLTSKYKHLGNVVHANGNMMQELRIRVGAAYTAFNQHRRNVYQNRHLGFEKRAQIFQACVLSILYWNCGTWSPLRPAEQRYFYGAAQRLVKRLLATQTAHEDLMTWPSLQTFTTAGFLVPELHIRICRLSYLGCLIRNGPLPLWALISTEGIWFRQIDDDMKWLSDSCQSKTFRPPFTCAEGPAFWETLIKCQPRTWSGLLKKAKAHALAQANLITNTAKFNADFLDLLIKEHPDLRPTHPVPLHAADDQLHFACIPCRRAFATKAGWAVHCFRVHSRRAPARYLADQPTCDHCGHSFLNAHRLYLHLRTSTACFKALRARGVSAQPAPGRGSKEWNAAEQFTLCPYLLAEGPVPPPPVDLNKDLAISPHEEELLLALLETEDFDSETNFVISPVERIWTYIRDVLCAHPVSFEEMAEVLRIWHALLLDRNRPFRRIMPTHMRSILKAIELSLQRLTLPWLCPDWVLEHPRTKQTCDTEGLIVSVSQTCHTTSAPGYGPKTIQPIFLYLFSGKRREGDLQCALENLDWGDAWTPIVISLDIILDKVHGDLLSLDSRSFWTCLLLKGCIDGALMRPPYESWSIARERWRLKTSGPRPLRDKNHPWGLQSLLLSELHQVLAANTLLQFSTLVFLILWLKGKFAMMEHPAPPADADFPDAPSIWYLPALQLLARLPEIELETLHQGYFGALSPKPSGILCARCPHPLPVFAQPFQTRKTLPLPLQIGRADDGSFAPYPMAFNVLIASSFKAWFDRCQDISLIAPDADEHNILRKFISHVGQGEAGQDYACI